MLLIISDDAASTNDIIDYLILYEVPFVRITRASKIDLNKIILNNEIFEFEIVIDDEIVLNSNDIKSVFIRKGNFFISKLTISSKSSLIKKIQNNLDYEKNIIKEIIYQILREKNLIGNLHNQNLNKINVLYFASKVGLKIPKSLISNNLDVINSFFISKNEVISKAIGEAPIIEDNKLLYMFYTADIDKLSNNPIDYSLFQKKIEKLFEIRSFFLDGKIFSMAILSQSDEMTKIDYRNYNENRPNRFVPYKLPIGVEDKINKLMNFLKLRTGSLDLIYSTTKEYYFLEINPVGQYGMVSFPCNYNLDKEIAKKLVFNEK